MAGRYKIGFAGAGQIGGVGATLACLKNLGDVALVDVAKGVPQGKALDLAQAGPIEGFDNAVVGSNDYAGSGRRARGDCDGGPAAQAGDEPG